MDIRILGWGYENIRRFGKLDIDLTQGNNTLPHVTLVMMRNGTGKTTTIHLIRSVLNGCATNWTAQQVREFRPKEHDAATGKFYLKIRFNMDVYYYVLTFDYESGTASYETSRVSNTSAVNSLVEMTEKAGAKVCDTVKIKYPGLFGGISEDTKKTVTEAVAKYYAELNN